MNPIHHPADDLLLEYANGSLALPLTLIVAGHLDACRTCRDTVALAENLGGLFLERTAGEEIDPQALARVLERLDSFALSGPVAAPQAQHDPQLPPALRRQPRRKSRWIAPGIWVRPIAKDTHSGTRAYLLGVGAGRAIPRHRHHGIEIGLIIKGSFVDDDVRYAAGDFFQYDAHQAHRPVVDTGEECVCAIASHGVPSGFLGLLIRLFA